MQKDFLIVGQGLCGTWISWWLMQEGKSVMVIDEGKPVSSSRIASGVINPVTGRVLAKTWMAETLLPFALEAYSSIGRALGIHCIQTVDILHAFPTEQMQQAFQNRSQEVTEYLSIPGDTQRWEQLMTAPFGFGVINPALLIDLNLLLNQWQHHLVRQHSIRLEPFNEDELEIYPDHVQYRDIEAGTIIYCGGVETMGSAYFNRLPFSPNKGEALLLEVRGLPQTHIYKKGLSLVPFPHFGYQSNAGFFWAGSTYENRFTHDEPTAGFRERTTRQLSEWLKLPFTVVDHWSAIRPATVERRPFVGVHPLHPRVAILNGTGTKGCSLAPYFARELAQYLIHGQPITKEADIQRFSRILSA
ncbi:FAD-binding oxidoreductase [Flavihumibacter rivuli]|uniref:NAD(P)/FAD-dependent oxidoreductase n=1 Tax=Flavihumibacter rivuli TaxID=2838156 RepID=UPI001BDF2DB7|nr:FAD-binding oxidoreductase [Flavihumibacter rivuli]ULQ56616.1 FAD-binding oxidoreductase [Flavihumibacter rivuli]